MIYKNHIKKWCTFYVKNFCTNLTQLNIKLIFLVFIITPIVFLNVTQKITAQQENQVEISDVEGLRTEFKQYTQSPSSKIIKFEMILKSNIDSDRVRVVWNASGPNKILEQPNYIVTDRTARQDIVIKKGQTYILPIEIQIIGEGVNEIFGRAEAFNAESTFLATVRKNFGSNSLAEVLPITDEYSQAKNLNTLLNFALIGLAIVIVIFTAFILLKRFLKWLDKDDRDF